MCRVQIVFLGTGTPNALPEKSGPAWALLVEQQVYLFECGPGIVRRAEAAARLGYSSLSMKNLQKVFISHLHSDHTAGFADLLLTPWVLGRETALQVFGPSGMKRMTHHLLQAYQVDIQNRIYGAEQANVQGIQVLCTEYKEGLVYEDDWIRVEAYPMQHPPFEAYGFRITTPNGIICFSGDTAPCDGILRAAQECEVLIHEVYSHTGVQSRTPKWYRYHTSVHTSECELATLVQQTRSRNVILTHQLWMLGENESSSEQAQEQREREILQYLSQVTTGKVFSAKDLDGFELDSKGNVSIVKM